MREKDRRRKRKAEDVERLRESKGERPQKGGRAGEREEFPPHEREEKRDFEGERREEKMGE